MVTELFWMGQGPRHHTNLSVSNFTTYREPQMKLLRCGLEKELSARLHSRTNVWSKNVSGFLKNDTCLCMRVCVLWHTCHGMLCGGQKTNSWSWLSPSVMWVSRTELSLSALAPRAFTHWAIALAQKLPSQSPADADAARQGSHLENQGMHWCFSPASTMRSSGPTAVKSIDCCGSCRMQPPSHLLSSPPDAPYSKTSAEWNLGIASKRPTEVG